MPVAWYLCPMLIGASGDGEQFRYCAMNQFNVVIFGDNGRWAETEVLGNLALVKVRASNVTLATIAAAPGFLRILAKAALTDSLADLTTIQRNSISNKLQDMGYSLAEISNALGGSLGGWRALTFGHLLRFVATRRLKPLRIETGNTVFSTSAVTPTGIDVVDGEV